MKTIEMKIRFNVPDDADKDTVVKSAMTLFMMHFEEAKKANNWDTDEIVDSITKLTNVNINPRFSLSGNTNLTFSQALDALKEGQLITRSGWNGKNTFLWMKSGDKVSKDKCYDPVLKGIAEVQEGEVECLPTICMKTADDKVVTGWIASQADMFATDWIAINIR